MTDLGLKYLAAFSLMLSFGINIDTGKRLFFSASGITSCKEDRNLGLTSNTSLLLLWTDPAWERSSCEIFQFINVICQLKMSWWSINLSIYSQMYTKLKKKKKPQWINAASTCRLNKIWLALQWSVRCVNISYKILDIMIKSSCCPQCI